MSLFQKKVSVTVHGYKSTGAGVDGRYAKQASFNKKLARKKKKSLVLVPRTIPELRKYIEETYGVQPLPETDELYSEAYEKLSSEGETDLDVYNIVVMQGSAPAAWLTVYTEANRNYLAFHKIHLECDDDYSVDRVIADIVNYFGAGKDDKKAKNERYMQLVSVQ
ncbi:MAG: hypothetical protein IK088_00115 [Lachnospiraceae bacterium]|nr:hypothetical protein [Lachnospiraceae bacterium]